MSEEMLYFIAHYIRKAEYESFERLGSMLGTNWSDEKIAALHSPASKSDTKGDFILPLAYLIEPNLRDMLKPDGGKRFVGGEQFDGEAEDLMAMPKEEFLALMGRPSAGD